jgi:hypothetical protein
MSEIDTYPYKTSLFERMNAQVSVGKYSMDLETNCAQNFKMRHLSIHKGRALDSSSTGSIWYGKGS